ncbi:hypothetical protein CMUS01_12940 [Colletotrichum musicola]|uniref:FAD-binding FR-type domain-containing protein n=1 Tax=Colletotrichum musicola TaxID=2175873 RepID=A0A8H6JH43_9PEZI|nr:hypothetical protein CMUS01_12940 [Colletotrichum musicola]
MTLPRYIPSPRQRCNERTLKTYAAFLIFLIFSVVAFRLLRNISDQGRRLHASKSDGNHWLWGRLQAAFRFAERPVDLGRLGKPTLASTILLGIFLVGNTALSTTNFALPHEVNHWASRFGWMAAANMAACVFFGLKNTPLSPLAAVSHVELNIFHRVVGYQAVFQTVVHAILYTIHCHRQHRLHTLFDEKNLYGIGAGAAMLVLLMGIYRHRAYELFYASHIIGCVVAVLLTAWHRPNWLKKLPLVMSIIAAVWAFDRLIRAAWMAWNFVNNEVRIYPLPGGGTRLLLKKPGLKTVKPGSYCYLWIPRIRPFESHPYTVVNNGPAGLELVLKSHRGFSKAVGKFATRSPGRALWASVDGPYGCPPTVEDYDCVILVAGGSGAASTVGLMNRLLSSRKQAQPRAIRFAWAVRQREHLSWFYDHIRNLCSAYPAMKASLYVSSTAAKASEVSDGQVGDLEAAQDRLLSGDGVSNYGTIQGKNTTLTFQVVSTLDDPNASIELLSTRMDVDLVVEDALGELKDGQRVLLAACGPMSLMDAVQESARNWKDRRSIALVVHCESFNY